MENILAPSILSADFLKLGEQIKHVGHGEFGADMKVALINDGPVTIIMDTKNKE